MPIGVGGCGEFVAGATSGRSVQPTDYRTFFSRARKSYNQQGTEMSACLSQCISPYLGLCWARLSPPPPFAVAESGCDVSVRTRTGRGRMTCRGETRAMEAT
jgi:hypothetical protein